MRALTLSRQALTYGLLGGVAALVAHEFGYAGAHTSAVDHSHIPVLATWFAVPALLAAARLLATLDRVRYSRILVLQVVLLLLLEVGERVAQSVPLGTLLSVPALIAMASAPVAAVLLLAPLGLGRVVICSVRARAIRVTPIDLGTVFSRSDLNRGQVHPRHSCARSPPSSRRTIEGDEMNGEFRWVQEHGGRSRSSSPWPRAVGAMPG